MGKDQYELSDAPSDSISSLKFAPQTPSRLVVASWDKNVYLFDVLNGGQVLRKYEHRAPVLDICYGDTDDVAFSCGLDWDVRRYIFHLYFRNVNLVLIYITGSILQPAIKKSSPRTLQALNLSSTHHKQSSSSPAPGTRHCMCTLSPTLRTHHAPSHYRANPSPSPSLPQNSSSPWQIVSFTFTPSQTYPTSVK